MVLNDAPDQVPILQIARHVAPGSSAIGALQKIRFVIPVLVIIERDIDRVLVKQVGANVIHERGVRNTWQASDFHPPPIRPAIFGDLNQSIICADIKQVLVDGRFPKRRDRIVLRHRQ